MAGKEEVRICPNCGHEMIRVGDIWVCPECEYHTGADPLSASFR